eukprot:6457448-Amphidinium_carterae.1
MPSSLSTPAHERRIHEFLLHHDNVGATLALRLAADGGRPGWRLRLLQLLQHLWQSQTPRRLSRCPQSIRQGSLLVAHRGVLAEAHDPIGVDLLRGVWHSLPAFPAPRA